uniref:Uncharacterized protein n=1 Tax=Arundo donax TaxID=35708 RepID=A0A0A9EWW6_ARUDO
MLWSVRELDHLIMHIPMEKHHSTIHLYIRSSSHHQPYIGC